MNIIVKNIGNTLNRIKEANIILYGDFCLDAYWVLDPRGSEISVETGLKALAAGSQKYSLGGASNVAANIAALRPKQLKIFGVAGGDIFGQEMIRQLKSIGIDTNGLVIQKENFETYTFSKLILEGNEQPRIDFGTYNKRTRATDEAILTSLRNNIKEADIIVINQQVPGSITNKEFIEGLNKLVSDNPEKIFIVDSRHFAAEFKGISLKTNELEAAHLYGIDTKLDDVFNINDVKKFACALFEKHNKPCFISRGKYGIVACDADGVSEIPGIHF